MADVQFDVATTGTDLDRRWTGVGASEEADSFVAGAYAAAQASAYADPKLYVVFSGHTHDHSSILDGVLSVAPETAQVIGCTTGGEIGIGGPSDGGVVVMAIGGSGISVATKFAKASGDLCGAGESAATCLKDVEDRVHTVLLLLSDGLAGDQQDLEWIAFAGTLPCGWSWPREDLHVVDDNFLGDRQSKCSLGRMGDARGREGANFLAVD